MCFRHKHGNLFLLERKLWLEPHIAADALKRPFGEPTIVIPIGSHDNNQHSFDESLRIQNLWDGIELTAALLTR
jgi:hypothetical protein